MSIYITLPLLMAVTVWIVDCSGFTDTWKQWLGRWLHVKVGRVRPFDCSTCMTWWVCLATVIISGKFDAATLASCALCGLLAKPMGAFLHTVVLACEGLNEIINRKIDTIWKKN